jgi:DMSO/TMAO reductase YedYZ molybdopterin-dependent catalytic subunit
MGVVVGRVVPPEGSTVMPMRSPGVTAEARSWGFWSWVSWSRPAERAPEGLVPVKEFAIAHFGTPNAGFYRVDTDLVLPQLSPDTWVLKIDGMVGRELEISFADLLRMPLTAPPRN